MALEVADINVEPATESDFVSGYRIAREVLAAAPGCRSVRLTQGIETPTRFTLLVEWDSVEAHLAFRASEQFAQWRAPIAQYFARPPYVEHFADV